MRNIECELRSFISKEKYDELLNFFKEEGEFLGEDNQVTYYFDCPQDLRIQQNDIYSKIWMKKGKIHDEQREEIEVRVPKEDFEKLESLFLSLGYEVEIKWFRKRNNFKWKDIDVALDFTKGYGYIIELEKMANEDSKDETLDELKAGFADLGIEISSREDFDQKYQNYKENWKELVK